MKFAVSRVSNPWRNEKPCGEAKEEAVLRFFSYTDPEEEGRIWSIELHTLEELLKFIEEKGSVVIGASDEHNGERDVSPWRIEIYDGWRE